MADISQLSDGVTTWDIKDATARSSIANAITTAGTGLSKSGNTLNHSNSVTAGWIGSSIATTGNVINMPYAQFDGQGHITNKGTITHTSWDRNTPWMLGDGFQGDQKVIQPWPYINVLNDGFWSLILRGATVSLSIDGGTPTTSGMSTLFDGSYDSAITTVPAGSTAVLTIDFTTMSTGYFPEVGTYSYGDIWLSFYYKCGAASVSARGYTDYNSIGWKNLTVTEVYTADTATAYRGTKWRITNPALYQMKTLEITYVGKASGTTPAGSSLSTVELNLSRPTTQMVPFVNKYSAQTLYYRLTAPQFNGVFEGNSSWYGTCETAAGTAAKIVSCSGFVLAKGAKITVYFSTANTVTNAAISLNVNSTGAKNVWYSGASTANAIPLGWQPRATLTFVYNGTYWVYLADTMNLNTDYTVQTNANTGLPYRKGYFRGFAVSSTSTGGPGVNGMVFETAHPVDTTYAAQLFLPTYQTSGRYPQWRATSGSNTWGTWNTFYTTANPPAFSEITGTVASSQLPIATTATVGAVKPDGTTVTINADGTLTAAGQTAGTGLTLDGNTLNHSNAVTAGTAGCTFKYDAQGHITPNGAYEHRLSVAANGNAGSAGRWYKVCTLPVNNSSNMATLIIEGRFGDYLVTRASYGRFLVGNRNGLSITCDFLTPNNSVASTEGLPAAFSKVDVVCYTQTDGTVNVYLKCVNYYFFDFVMRLCNNGTDAAYYGTYTYDGTYVTTEPSGALDAQASTASGGVFNAPRIRSSLVQANTSYYGTCSTAASTAAKVVACSSFVLATGAQISVLFQYAQTVTSAWTLNVNGTGAKTVYKDGKATANGNSVCWGMVNQVANFIYNGTGWAFIGTTGMLFGPETEPTSLNDMAQMRGNSLTHVAGFGNTTTGHPGGTGHILSMTAKNSNYYGAQLYIPNNASSTPQWRANDNGTWTSWDSFYTAAHPIVATASTVGGVKPDGQSIIVSGDGTLTATPAAVGMTCTERSGGVSLDTYDLETASGSWPADGGWGWREEVWNDGRMTLYWWKWFATTGSGWQQLWTNLPYPTDATAFVDTPNTQVSLFDNAVSVQGAAMIKPTSLRTSSNTTGFKMTYYNSAANTNAKTLVLFRADGHWWKANVDPDDPTPAEEWAVGDAISIGGNSYYPVTEWKVSDSGAGGDSRLKAAVRFLITTSSTSGAWHVYAQYAAWTDSGYVPTSSQNGYMLIRKLNSQITTYTNDAGVKAKGDVWSALNTNQRQGYVSNGVVEGHLIWGDTPYIITDCGTFTNGQTVSSKTFYVGTTEVNGGVYTQTSVSDTTTTPTSN